MVAAEAVVAIDRAGSVLGVGAPVWPAATAWLPTDRLGSMPAIAVAAAALAGAGGGWLGRVLDGSIAGSMATVAGEPFGAARVAAPRHEAGACRTRRRAARRALTEGPREGVA